ncbi:MAG: hypothetical protein IJB85_13510 [Clostridia bacterium]|nr:hypothetical protein [Clostridia bacterium]
MKKWNMMLLALLLLTMPAAGSAQDLPELFTQVYQSVGEGLLQGTALAAQAAQKELTLEMTADSERLEAGKKVRLTITAGNPLPQEAPVAFTLALPERVRASGETVWEAVLPAAELDDATGELAASVTTITRELTLMPGGGSEQCALTCEMAMGTRFYRAGTQLALCVPRISVSAQLEDEAHGRIQPGDTFAYRVKIINSGNAPKDVALEMILPQDAEPVLPLPAGFAQEGRKLCGQVQMDAAAEAEAETELVFPMTVAEGALDGDTDAQRLMAATLRADGEHVNMPRVQVCAPKISARLMTPKESFEAGEESVLSIVLVNSGLAGGDARLSCVLPEGLVLADAQKKAPRATDEPEKAVIAEGEDGLPGVGEEIPVQQEQMLPVMTQEDRTLVFDVHVGAAKETADGVIAHTQVIEIPVRANVPQQMTEALMGASLAWTVDNGDTQLGEAVALRVHPREFLGMTRADWNGVFWTSVLLLLTVVCLYAAIHKDKKEEEYCFE